jgi:hypothetical protein
LAFLQESSGHDENLGHLGILIGHRLAGILLLAGLIKSQRAKSIIIVDYICCSVGRDKELAVLQCQHRQGEGILKGEVSLYH